MGTAWEEHERLEEMLREATIPDDEPVFILRAQDILAPGIVEEWAERFKNTVPQTVSNQAKRAAARQCADAMRRWPVRKLPD